MYRKPLVTIALPARVRHWWDHQEPTPLVRDAGYEERIAAFVSAHSPAPCASTAQINQCVSGTCDCTPAVVEPSGVVCSPGAGSRNVIGERITFPTLAQWRATHNVLGQPLPTRNTTRTFTRDQQVRGRG